MIGLSIGFITIVLIMILVTYISTKQMYDGVSLSSKGDKVAVIELLGPMYDSQRISRQFKIFGEHRSVRAIVFRIDSPGGGVAVAQEIYDAVKRVRDSGKPVVVSMGSVAASGGYYVACGADTIMANPGTTTGSIGVIAEFANFKELIRKIGIQVQTVKSGTFKDTGSPHRELTSEEKRYLQEWVDDAYQQFVEVVVRERGLPLEKVKALADGRVFTGRKALELGLIDLLGDYEDAIQLAASMSGIKGEPEIIKEKKRTITLLDLLFEQIEGIFRGTGSVQLRYGLPY